MSQRLTGVFNTYSSVLSGTYSTDPKMNRKIMINTESLITILNIADKSFFNFSGYSYENVRIYDANRNPHSLRNLQRTVIGTILMSVIFMLTSAIKKIVLAGLRFIYKA